jgi:hypothetical protein
MERAARFQSLLLHISWNPQSTVSPDKTKSHLRLKIVGKGASPPSWSPTGPVWSEMSYFQSQWFIHSFLLDSAVRSSPTKHGENIWSASTEPQADGRPTSNEVRPGSPGDAHARCMLKLRLETHTKNMQYLLVLHGNIGYVIHTLTLLFVFLFFRGPTLFKYIIVVV